jgi:hypothetical protein
MSGGVGSVSLGMPELFIILMMLLPGLVGLAAGAWALYTLYKMRSALDRIEQHLRTRGGP